MSFTHTHHIIPKYEGGGDELSNLVELTSTQHAMWHYEEWLRKGNEQDRIAWRGLSGFTAHSETREAAIRYGSKKAREARKINNPNWHKELIKAALRKQKWLRENDETWRNAEVSRLRELSIKNGHKGGKAGLGKGWWHNEATGETTKSKQKPGEGWRIGKAPFPLESRKRQKEAMKGMVFWNNGEISTRLRECQGRGGSKEDYLINQSMTKEFGQIKGKV